MICQMLLPFAHAAVMTQELGSAWCGIGPQPIPQWSAETQQDAPDEQVAKKMMCTVCATAGAHGLLPPTAIFVLPLAQADLAAELVPDHTQFTFPSFAIPPPPRGPPLIS